MKPSEPFRQNEFELAKETGRLVADIIQKMNLVKKAIIVSFDFRKVKVVKDTNPNITVGTLFTQKFASKSKNDYLQIGGFGNLKQCVKDGPDEPAELFQLIFESGIYFKVSGSSSLDCDLKLYDNPLYSNHTIQTLRHNYSSTISSGFYTMYSLGKKEQQNVLDEKKARTLIQLNGGQRIITDDVKRVRKFLSKTSSSGSIAMHHGIRMILMIPLFNFLVRLM